MKIPKSSRWLFSPAFNTADLAQVGEELEVDLYFPPNGASWWTIEMQFRTPTGTSTSLGTLGMSGMTGNAWNTLSFTLPQSVRNILLGDNPNYQFVFKTNSGWQASNKPRWASTWLNRALQRSNRTQYHQSRWQ